MLKQLVSVESPERPVAETAEAEGRVRQANGQIYSRNLQTLADLCRRHNVKLVLITFLHDDVNMPPYFSTTLKYHNDLMREIARSEGVALIDLEEQFRPLPAKAEYFCRDHYHPSRKGADFIARTLAPAMKALLQPSPRQ